MGRMGKKEDISKAGGHSETQGQAQAWYSSLCAETAGALGPWDKERHEGAWVGVKKGKGGVKFMKHF